MNEEDKKEFLDDFRKANGEKKLDMWYYALEQEVLWEQILTEMSTIAKEQKIETILTPELYQKILRVKERYGLKSNANVLRILILEEYRRIGKEAEAHREYEHWLKIRNQ